MAGVKGQSPLWGCGGNAPTIATVLSYPPMRRLLTKLAGWLLALIALALGIEAIRRRHAVARGRAAGVTLRRLGAEAAVKTAEADKAREDASHALLEARRREEEVHAEAEAIEKKLQARQGRLDALLARLDRWGVRGDRPQGDDPSDPALD